MKQVKLNALLEHHYNLFHARLIEVALEDDDIDKWDFIKGIKAIRSAEVLGNDEFIPVQFEHLVNK